jgi:predicted enzyme related to lactoylglutathione lyase
MSLGGPVNELRLTLLVLKTRQLARLRAFYTAVGLAFVEEVHGNGPAHLAASVGGLVLELYPLPDDAGPADATTRVGFAVSDLDATLVSLGAVQGTAVSQPKDTPWGRRAVVRDPDGRAVELVEG